MNITNAIDITATTLLTTTATVEANASSDQLQNAGRYVLVALNGIVRVLIGLVGVVANSFFVALVARNKVFWSSTGLLLAMLAAFELTIGAFSLVTLYFGVTGNIAIDLLTCFWAISPATFAFLNSPMLMLLTAFDRLLAVIFPMWYTRMNNNRSKLRTHVTLLLLTSLIASSLMFWMELVNVIDAQSSDPTTIKCSVDDLLTGRGESSNNVMLGILVATMVCYFVAITIVFAMKLPDQRRILTSLAAIVVLVFVCWVLSLTLRTYVVMALFPEPVLPALYLISFAGALTAVSQSVNTFVLYKFSAFYRQHIRAECEKLLKRVFGKRTTGGSTTTTTTVVTRERRAQQGGDIATHNQHQQSESAVVSIRWVSSADKNQASSFAAAAPLQRHR